MRLYYETVSKTLLECLKKLMENNAFKEFILVGGTALCLQRGHRMSVDIDLFTDNEYGSMNLEKIKKALINIFPYTESLETLNERNLGYMVYVGNNKEEKIKLDLFYTEKFIMPIIEQDGLRLASLQDIAAMKMLAITNNKRKKDFWDLHELLECFTLEEIIQFGVLRNPYSLDIKDIICSLQNANNYSQDSTIKCFKGKFWELIVEDIETTVEQYINNSFSS